MGGELLLVPFGLCAGQGSRLARYVPKAARGPPRQLLLGLSDHRKSATRPIAMACVHLPSGQQVMTADMFQQWWEEKQEPRESGECFLDQLRQEVARQMKPELRNFRQLSLACRDRLLGPGSPWSDAESVVAVVQPYVQGSEEEQKELFEAAQRGDLESVLLSVLLVLQVLTFSL